MSNSPLHIADADSFAPQVQSRAARAWTGGTLWAALAFAACWVIYTVGTARLSQWFPLDLPYIFHTADHLAESLPLLISPYNGSGRFVPGYWLFWIGQYKLFHATVWPYLLVQGVVFLGGALLASWLIYRLTRSRGAALLLLAGLYLSSPVAENLTTIGKGETVSFTFVMATLAVAWIGHRLAGRRSWLMAAAAGILFVLAIWTKETALVLLGFAAVGAIVTAVVQRLPSWREEAPSNRFFLWLSGALAFGAVLWRLPYFLFPRKVQGAYYTDYKLTWDLVTENVRFYLEQQPDVLATGVLGAALLLFALYRRRAVLAPAGTARAEHLVFALSMCAMGWGYWLAMQLWRWPMPYYMLLPGAAFKFAAVYAVWYHLRASALRTWAKRAAVGVLVLAATWGGLVLFYVSASQVAYSRIYTEALTEVARNVRAPHRLVIESYPFFAEQISGTERLLRNRLGANVSVGGIGEIIEPSVLQQDILDMLDVKQQDIDANIKTVPGKGDFLLAFTGSKLASWFLRGVTPYYMPDSSLKMQGSYEMEHVAERTITTPAAFLHVWNHRPATDRTWLGYKLYRITNDEPRFLWTGRFPDGWAGAKTSLIVNRSYGKPVALAISAPPYILPVTVTVRRDGQVAKVLDLRTPDEVVVDLGEVEKTTVFTIESPKTFTGKGMEINRDKRKLSVRAALVDRRPPQ
jgi:hypothetical protein